MKENQMPGLYEPQFEHDACGIGFVAHLKGKKSHDIVEKAIYMLTKMEHRGACGCETNTGDGAGILIQKPHEFLKEECDKIGIKLPEYDDYGVGQVFFPKEKDKREKCREVLVKGIEKVGLKTLGFRQVPSWNGQIGPSSKNVEPDIEQVFVERPQGMSVDDFERKLFVARNYSSHTIHRTIEDTVDSFYIATFSYKTIVYKGQLTTEQVRPYFPDLQDERVVSAIGVVHSRFSTNTFPKWKLAQPFRYIAHNGEINTVRGNVNWMKSREADFVTDHFTKEELEMITPICDHKQSDSANLDNAIEMMVHNGRSLPHVMMMLVPEAWQTNESMDPKKRAFYDYHANLMEPWDGPASISFTDGKIVGATLDRNGLRPSRYLLTDDDILVMASETGALPVDPEKVVKRGRLQPGRIFVANLEEGRIISDEELKQEIATGKPYEEWLARHKKHISDLNPDEYKDKVDTYDEELLLNRQQAFGYTSEDLKVLIAPMAEGGKEPLGSMGTDTPLPILSEHSQHIANYFKQLFAQVTNPPIDPIRERMVMSLFTSVGPCVNILEAKPEHCAKLNFDQPLLTNEEMAAVKELNNDAFKTIVIDTVFEATDKPGSLEAGIDKVCKEAIQSVKDGYNIIVLSDKNIDKNKAPIPTLLATGAVHHILVDKGLRARTGILVEGGDVRETQHLATLIGYGAAGANPYLAIETIKSMKKSGLVNPELSEKDLIKNYIKAIGGGLLKIFSKMGISTLQSYQGAQIFECLGLHNSVVEKCFAGTVSRIGGLDFDGLGKEALIKHKLAYPEVAVTKPRLEVGGVYQWKRRGEAHLFNPESIHLLQHSSKTNNYQLYKKYSQLINDQSKKAFTLRGLMEFTNKKPIPINEVEPVENIFKRFATGAMSFGSISHEAHSTLAIAMNRIGGKSNSGEGGEDEIRFFPKENGDWERSAIKQVASGRFGVTSYYLTNADEIQIKMAQGAKPGEGGQLPGHKVDEWIGRVRHSTPGVGLISPPPHHDIYSIEDLAQLIYDLKNANRQARINVKLVSEAGVGTVAAGVSKAHADVVLISGHDGGTGASPISSIKHAGLPWELGLSEAHQTLVRNKLRGRITVQADGQMKTGRDLAVAALLGAEEFGVATAALVVEGCIMMRKCHLNTCPVGVATQHPELRKRFPGDADHVVNFFTFLAQELREIMAELGFRTINEMVGQVDRLKMRDDITHWKYKNLDLSRILYKESADEEAALFKCEEQDHGIAHVMDWTLLEKAKPALENQEKVTGEFDIINTDRAVGTILSNEISKKYRGDGLPDGTIHFKFTGSAGQSFGAFSAKGLKLELEGDANDYFGKGLSGSKLILYPNKKSPYKPSHNIVVGNVAFYGATSGEAYIRGIAGERFCVRNSGVRAVVEGVGDHGCEYMTGGVAVILGETGRNFAAGMSGGIAFIYDEKEDFMPKCNKEMVDFDPLDHNDVKTLRKLIDNHYRYTGSDVAEKILNDWDKEIEKFVKVMPRDYKAVLLQRKIKTFEENKDNKEVEVHG